MKAFAFGLEKVLEWRRIELEREEIRLRRHNAALADLHRLRAEWDSQGSTAEEQVRHWDRVAGSELEALGCYRMYARTKGEELARALEQRRRERDRQQELMLEARRRLRLLERLRERRLAEWTAARDKELEELASESFLARWGRE